MGGSCAMTGPLPILEALLAGLGFAAVFFLSLAESALVSASRADLEALARAGNSRAALVVRLTAGYKDCISAILVSINIAVILISTSMTLLFFRLLGEQAGAGEKLLHVATVAAILLFCEITPKSYAVRDPERLAMKVARPVYALTWVLQHLVRVLRWIAIGLITLAGGEPGKPGHFVTEDEIRGLASVAEEEGVVEPQEREMLEGVIELQTTTAREVMVPRMDMVALPTTATVDEAIEVVQEYGFSRIPLYEHDIDQILGVLYVNDLITELAQGYHEVPLASVARQVPFVPESKKIDELFEELRQAKVHVAIVIDEYGATEGLVSMEDILEEIVGEIEDEHDVPADSIVRISEREALIDARADLDDVNSELNTFFPEGPYDTIGGFVFEQAGKIPEVGEQVRWENVTLTVVEREGLRIGKLRLVRDEPAEILRLSEEEVVVQGNTQLRQLSQALGAELEGDPDQTVGALLLEELGGESERGAQVSLGPYELTVLKGNGTTIEQVRVTPGTRLGRGAGRGSQA